MGCLRFCFILIPAFLSVVALVLSAMACAGSSKNNSFLTNIYYINLDLSGMNASSLLGSLSPLFSSIVAESDHVNRELGLSDVYTFGMWGYCKGNLKDDTELDNYNTDNVNFTYCSSPKLMYVFNPASALLADISGSNSTDDSDISESIVELTKAGIELPSGVEDYMKVLTLLSKLIFICTIIGICLVFLQILLSVFTVCSTSVSCLVYFLLILSFLALILACGGSTGVFMYMRKEFNNEASDYGISAHLSRNYLVFFWLGAMACLVATIFWMFSVCCCSTSPFFGRRRGNVNSAYVGDSYREKL